MNGVQVAQAAGVGDAPTVSSIVETGDFNGDGKSDLLWQDTSGNVAMWFMNGVQVAQSSTARPVSRLTRARTSSINSSSLFHLHPIKVRRRLNPNNRTTFTYVGGRVEMVRLPEFAIDAAEQRRFPVASYISGRPVAGSYPPKARVSRRVLRRSLPNLRLSSARWPDCSGRAPPALDPPPDRRAAFRF
jgi:hypothetical protein